MKAAVEIPGNDGHKIGTTAHDIDFRAAHGEVRFLSWVDFVTYFVVLLNPYSGIHK